MPAITHSFISRNVGETVPLDALHKTWNSRIAGGQRTE